MERRNRSLRALAWLVVASLEGSVSEALAPIRAGSSSTALPFPFLYGDAASGRGPDRDFGRTAWSHTGWPGTKCAVTFEPCAEGRAAASTSTSRSQQNSGPIRNLLTRLEKIFRQRAHALSERYTAHRSSHRGCHPRTRTCIFCCQASHSLWCESARRPGSTAFCRGCLGANAYYMGASRWRLTSRSHATWFSDSQHGTGCTQTAHARGTAAARTIRGHSHAFRPASACFDPMYGSHSPSHHGSISLAYYADDEQRTAATSAALWSSWFYADSTCTTSSGGQCRGPITARRRRSWAEWLLQWTGPGPLRAHGRSYHSRPRKWGASASFQCQPGSSGQKSSSSGYLTPICQEAYETQIALSRTGKPMPEAGSCQGGGSAQGSSCTGFSSLAAGRGGCTGRSCQQSFWVVCSSRKLWPIRCYAALWEAHGAWAPCAQVRSSYATTCTRRAKTDCHCGGGRTRGRHGRGPPGSTLIHIRTESLVGMSKRHGYSSLPGPGAFEIHWDGFHRTVPPVGQCYIRAACPSLTCGLFRFHPVACSLRSLQTGRRSCFFAGPVTPAAGFSSQLPASSLGLLSSIATLPWTLGFVSEGFGPRSRQVLTGTSWPLSIPTLPVTARAGSATMVLLTASPTAGPKMCIGGSGAHSVCSVGAQYAPSAPASYSATFGSNLTTLFVMWSLPVLTFFQTLLVISTASLCNLLLSQMPGSRSPLGCLCRLPFAAASTSAALPWRSASPANTPLCRPHRPIPQGRGPSTTHRSRLRFRWLSRPIWWFLGFSTLPQVVWSIPLAARDKPILQQAYRDMHCDAQMSHPSCSTDIAPDLGSCLAPNTAVNMPSDISPMRQPDIPASPAGPTITATVQCSGLLEEIGVKVFVPFCHSTNVQVFADRSAGLDKFCEDVKALKDRPFPEHDCVVALKPQQFMGMMDVISYHSLLDRLPAPHKAVVLDLSRVGGHCHATVLPACTTWDALAHQVCRLLNLDVFEEPVNIWKGSNMELLGKSSPFYLQHGETLIFMRTEFGPPVVFEAADFFQESVKWYEFSHLPSCQDTRCLAVCTTEELYPVDPYYYRHVPSQEIALRSTGLDPTTHGVTEVDISPALDLDGETCATIQVITAADSCSDATGKGHYLLDLRPISRRPRMVTYEDTRHDLPDILSAAGVSFPSGQCGELLRTRVVGSIQVLTIGVVADLAEKIFNSGIWASVTPVTTSASGPPPPDSAPPWRHAQDRHAAGLHAPPRFDREPHSPSPHRALGLDEVTDTETMEELALPFQMGVHVMMPDFQDEILHVHLTAPCTVDHALSAISEARDTTASLHLDVLVPAHPQPDPSFACVLAIPAWTTHANFGVADLRAIDGRLFVHAFPARLNRSSLLLHFEVPDYPGLQVYIADQLLDPLPWYELPLAVTVTVLPPDFAFWPGHSLDMMLHRDWGWAVPCPTFGGLEGPNFLLLSDGNRRILKVDEARATSSAYLKQEAVRLFRYEEYKVTVCPTVPRTRNAAYLGWHCDAVFTATEAINRTPVPPGRLQTRQHIVFLDRRLLLQAFAWQLAPHGVLDWDKLLRRLQACAPEGFSVSIQGGRQEHKGMRTFLHVEHGEVLLCVPVADDQHTDAEQVSSTEPSMPGPSQSPASSDSSDSTSEKTGSAHVSQEHSVPDPARYEPASRSRSPANRRPITGHGARLARQTLMGMGCVHLGHPVHGHLMSSWLPASWEPPLPTALPIEGFRLGDFHQLSCATLPGTLLQQTSPVLTSLLLWTHTWQSALCQFLAYLAFLLSHALCPPSRQHGRVRRARDGPRANKQLDEPTGSTPADSLRLRTLRHITRVMGGRWLRNWSHQPLEAAPFGYPVPDDTESEPEDDTAQIHFVVLKHDYVPEHAVAPLHLPATQSEAMALLRDQRDPTARHLFPALLPVIPQPRQATACFLASPAWNPGWHTICIDTSRVDNRIFAAFVPEYATRRDILLLAEIPLGIDPIVWLGPSDSILEDDIRTHLFPGALVCVFPAEDVTPRLQSLGEMLLRPNLWQGESDFPEARGLRAYCLAHRRQGQLYVPDPSRPMNYRREIAEAVGSRPESLILFPARPRPQDVAISGVTCRTVIGVSDRRHSSSGLNAHMVLLDCRPVEEGWKAFWVPGTGLDLGQLLDLFDDSTPQGWQACVMELPRRHGLLPTEPGQVLTIFYAHSGIFEMGHNSPPGNSGPPPTTEPSHTTAPAQAAPAASAASAGVVQAAERNLPSSSPGLQAAVGQANAQPRTSLHFLVLTPEYAPEHITVQAELPARAEAIVLEVDAARDPAKRAFFPVPLPVPLQPAFSFVSLLAVPRWPFVGVPFLITCFLPPVHVLPVIGPAVLTAEGVLRLAGVNADAPARVFSSDAPWPLRWGDRFHVRQGDSITILPDDQPFIPPVPLQHFFDTSDGWRDDLIIPGPTEDAAWVLTEQIAWRLPASEQDGRSMRETVATQLQAHPDEVEVLPATPSIGDHCRFGFPSNRVFIAGPLDLPGHIPYIIDSRPVLTQLYWATAERGCVDVASICASHRHRCPRDHFVRLTGGHSPPGQEIITTGIFSRVKSYALNTCPAEIVFDSRLMTMIKAREVHQRTRTLTPRDTMIQTLLSRPPHLHLQVRMPALAVHSKVITPVACTTPHFPSTGRVPIQCWTSVSWVYRSTPFCQAARLSPLPVTVILLPLSAFGSVPSNSHSNIYSEILLPSSGARLSLLFGLLQAVAE